MKLYGLSLPGDVRGWVFTTDRDGAVDAARDWARLNPKHAQCPRIAEIPVDVVYSYVRDEGLVPEIDLVEDPTLDLTEPVDGE